MTYRQLRDQGCTVLCRLLWEVSATTMQWAMSLKSSPWTSSMPCESPDSYLAIYTDEAALRALATGTFRGGVVVNPSPEPLPCIPDKRRLRSLLPGYVIKGGVGKDSWTLTPNPDIGLLRLLWGTPCAHDIDYRMDGDICARCGEILTEGKSDGR